MGNPWQMVSAAVTDGADLSPNNRGFAMAVWRPALTTPLPASCLAPIDNKLTPSYLSHNLGRLRGSRRICPKSAVFPERRKSIPVAVA